MLDLLPHAVSGVYFVYHTDFEKFSFGKLSALREAAFALEQDYQYYYMGYYIHTCKKMRYKADFKPQHVLDINTYDWDPMNDDLQRLMDRTKYASMSRERQELASLEKDARDQPDAADGQSPLEEEAVLHPSPLEAMESNLSLLRLGMPGVLTLSQLHEQIDLDEMKVHIGRGGIHEMQVSRSAKAKQDPFHPLCHPRVPPFRPLTLRLGK